MRCMEYASFLESGKHVMQVQLHFGRIMRHYDSFGK
jgi:hypothetical protein